MSRISAALRSRTTCDRSGGNLLAASSRRPRSRLKRRATDSRSSDAATGGAEKFLLSRSRAKPNACAAETGKFVPGRPRITTARSETSATARTSSRGIGSPTFTIVRTEMRSKASFFELSDSPAISPQPFRPPCGPARQKNTTSPGRTRDLYCVSFHWVSSSGCELSNLRCTRTPSTYWKSQY